MYQIVDWERDKADKWRFRVAIGGQTIMFKFDTMPDDQELHALAARYEAMTQEQVNGAPDPV